MSNLDKGVVIKIYLVFLLKFEISYKNHMISCYISQSGTILSSILLIKSYYSIRIFYKIMFL